MNPEVLHRAAEGDPDRRRAEHDRLPHPPLRGGAGLDATQALEASKKLIHDAFADPKGKSLLWALIQTRRNLMNVKVDRTIVKPKVSIIGEFWAMTTEGDGNYGLQKFLEAEGAECDIQPVTAWILFMIWEQTWDTQQRMVLRGEDKARKGLAGVNVRKKLAMLWLAKHAIKGVVLRHRPHHGPARRAPGRHGRRRAGGGAVLQQPPPRRRRPHGGRQADPQHRQGEGDDDPVGEAVRLHAVGGRLRRRPVDHHGEVPAGDLLRDRDQRRRRGERLLARADDAVQGAAGGEGRVQGRARGDRPDGRGDARLPGEEALARVVAVLSAPRHGGQHGGQPGAARGRRHQEDAHGEDHRLHQARARAPVGQGRARGAQRSRSRARRRRRTSRSRHAASA